MKNTATQKHNKKVAATNNQKKTSLKTHHNKAAQWENTAETTSPHAAVNQQQKDTAEISAPHAAANQYQKDTAETSAPHAASTQGRGKTAEKATSWAKIKTSSYLENTAEISATSATANQQQKDTAEISTTSATVNQRQKNTAEISAPHATSTQGGGKTAEKTPSWAKIKTSSYLENTAEISTTSATANQHQKNTAEISSLHATSTQGGGNDQHFPCPQNVNHKKFQRQIALEKEMKTLGFEKMLKLIENAEQNNRQFHTPYGSFLVRSGIKPLAEAIDNFLNNDNNKTGRKHTAAKLIETIGDNKKTAFLSLKQLINMITKPQTLAKTATAIGDLLEKEAALLTFKKTFPNDYNKLSRITKTLPAHSKHSILKSYMEKFNMDLPKWTLNQRVQIGTKLIDMIAVSTNYITIQPVKDKVSRHNVNMVMPHPNCMELIENIRSSALMTTEYLPMITPPKEWTNPYNGGYYTQSYPLVKARFGNKKVSDESMETVYTAVNAMQNTAYRINKKVYETALALWQMGNSPTLPQREKRQIPPCPICGEIFVSTVNPPVHNHNNFAHDNEQTLNANPLTGEDMPPMTAAAKNANKHHCFQNPHNKDKFIAWKRSVNETETFNLKLIGKQIHTMKIFHLAEKFVDEESIYFPIQLDFRGRAYPVCSFLNPQGSDMAKGFLEFAQGKPLISFDSVKWLAVHGANMFGNDKIPFDDRFLWVLDNEDEIIAAATSPLSNLWWQKASKPFEFLAFCFEWAEYVKCCLKEKPFFSHIPTAMDGTCNGLQIYSMLMRDEVGGMATNLIKNHTPTDIYGIVAEKTVNALKNLQINGKIQYKKDSKNILLDEKAAAAMLLNLGIDRLTTKRQVMTLPYGATFTSCREYTMEWLLQKKEASQELFPNHINIYSISVFLSQIIWQAINETVSGAKQAMEYLRGTAQVLSKAGSPIRWTTPVGFKVEQAYKSVSHRRIKCELGDGCVFISVKEEDEKIDVRFQKNGICPNFIHSLDAAAMMKTIEIALKKGVNSFAMVHDSYACHAADRHLLSTGLREAFAELFKEDLLKNFGKEATACLSSPEAATLPPLPQTGTLNIMDIMESDYFFG
ncbi:MAG: hypothetical protein IJD28_00215 [Deferribacterales bacterium]|nr:hypothetical protein [Deferribacterales bacterium]